MDYVCGGISGMTATLFSNPFDMVKTRLMVQGELKAKGAQAVHYKHVFHALYLIVKEEGILSLQKGLVPSLIFQAIFNGIRLGMFNDAQRRGWNKNKNGDINPYKTAVVSAVTGIIGNYAGNPFYVIKTQIQIQAPKEFAQGYQHQHKGTLSALKNLHEEAGILGFWRGSTAAVPKMGVACGAQLGFFALGKNILIKYNILSEEKSPAQILLLASVFSGAFVAVLMTPLDLVQTRLYNQAMDTKGQGVVYKGVADCFVKTFKAEGFFGLFKGIGSCCLRVGPHTVITLSLSEILRKKFVDKSL